MERAGVLLRVRVRGWDWDIARVTGGALIANTI